MFVSCNGTAINIDALACFQKETDLNISFTFISKQKIEVAFSSIERRDLVYRQLLSTINRPQKYE